MKLWNSPARILYKKTVSQLISVHQRNPSKKCPDNKGINFILNDCLSINQFVGKHQSALENLLYGRPDNNNYEADWAHNQTVMQQGETYD